MTTTNVYQGLTDNKSSSRVTKAPGGNSSNIFGHYVEEDDRQKQALKEAETKRISQPQSQSEHVDVGYYDSRNSYAANRARNQTMDAPFATASTDAQTNAPARQEVTTRNPCSADNFEYMTPKERQAQNPNKNQNTFSNLFGDSDAVDTPSAKPKGQAFNNPANAAGRGEEVKYDDEPMHPRQAVQRAFPIPLHRLPVNPITGLSPFTSSHSHVHASAPISHIDSERNPLTGDGCKIQSSPMIKCYGDINAAACERNPLTGNGIKIVQSPTKSYVNVATHNPVTWEAYSNYDPQTDQPIHRSRFESHAANKQGQFNPITGEEGGRPSTKVAVPPGGVSSITF